jgi:dihydroneopterin aldolase
MLREYVLRLQAIRFRANLGASSSERAIPQEIVVDVELTLPVSAMPAHDNKRDVVDYNAVANLVVDEGLAKPWRLLETYAARLVEQLLEKTPAVRVKISATKLRVPTTHSVDKAIVELVGTREG